MKPTDTNIAIFYEVDRKTISNYKNGTKGKQRLYEAMREYFIKVTKSNT